MAIPTLTLGIDLPGAASSSGVTTQVGSATQGVVNTVTQTAAPAVTTVENTVQQVAPAAAPAPAPAEATPQQAVQQVESTVQQVTSAAPHINANAAPKGASRAAPKGTSKAAPRSASKTIRNPASRNAPKTASAQTRLTKAGTLAAAKGSAQKAVQRGTNGKVTTNLLATGAPSEQKTAAGSTPSCLSLPTLSVLSSALDLNALLAIACGVTTVLNPPATADGAPSSPDPSVVKILGVIANAGTLAHRALAEATANTTTRLRTLAGPAGSQNFPGGAGRGAVAGATASGFGRKGGDSAATNYAAPLAIGPNASAASGFRSAKTSGHEHHGVFSGPVDGTSLLRLILTLDLALLGAIFTWRVAQRWVVPRYA